MCIFFTCIRACAFPFPICSSRSRSILSLSSPASNNDCASFAALAADCSVSCLRCFIAASLPLRIVLTAAKASFMACNCAILRFSSSTSSKEALSDDEDEDEEDEDRFPPPPPSSSSSSTLSSSYHFLLLLLLIFVCYETGCNQ